MRQKVLKNIVNVGRYKNPVTKKIEEVKVGTCPKRGTYIYFYMNNNSKIEVINKRIFQTKWDIEII